MLWRSDLERRADASQLSATAAELELQPTIAVVRHHLRAAIDRHPLVALLVDATALPAAVKVLRVVGGGKYRPPPVFGIEQAWRQLRTWTSRALAVAGPLEPAADVLVRDGTAKVLLRRGFTDPAASPSLAGPLLAARHPPL